MKTFPHTTPTPAPACASSLLERLIPAYFEQRDVDALLPLLAENAIWCSLSGLRAVGRLAVAQMLGKESAALPEHLQTELLYATEQPLGPEAAAVQADVRVLPDGDEALSIIIRLSITCQQTRGAWCISMMHASLPDSTLSSSRIFPAQACLEEIRAEKEQREMLEAAASRLRGRQRRLDAALAHSEMFVWEYDIAHGRGLYNDRVQRAFNLPAVLEGYPNAVIFTGLIHPESEQEFFRIHAELSAGKPVVTGRLRLRAGDGRYLWHKICYTVQFDGQGEPVSAIGLSENISEQLRIERRYEEALNLYTGSRAQGASAMSLNLTTDRVLEADCFWRAGQTQTPLSAAAMLKDLQARVLGGPERARFAAVMGRGALMLRFAEGEPSATVETQILQDDGVTAWMRISARMKSAENGDMLAFIFMEDITRETVTRGLMYCAVNTEYDYITYIDATIDCCVFSLSREGCLSAPPQEQCSYSDFMQAMARRWTADPAAHMRALSLAAVLEHLEADGEYTQYVELCMPDGSRARKRLRFIFQDRLRMHIIHSCADVTDVYREQQARNQELSAALAAAEKTNKARGDFLSYMSHEIRTPLNGILGMLDLLHDQPGPDSPLYLDRAILSARHLAGLINDVLDMSKIDSGTLELAPDWMEMDEFLRYVDAVIAPQAEEKKVDFQLALPPSDSFSIFVDGSRLKQACLNLLSNAVKYTAAGGHVIWRLEQRADGEDMRLLSFAIEDNGIGMSADFLKSAFRPFVQASAGNARIGTGLGLAITKRLVEMMGGELHTESAPGKGTTMSFSLRVRARKSLPHIGANAAAAGQPFQGRRALLVDDHDINLLIAEKRLKMLGMQVDVARDGAQALHRFMESPVGWYDVILMDIMMPVMDGYTATRRIRALPRRDAHIPIVAMTANAFAEDVTKSLACGMDCHLSKPFEAEQLARVLADLFLPPATA